MWSIQLKLTLINWSLHCLIVNFATTLMSIQRGADGLGSEGLWGVFAPGGKSGGSSRALVSSGFYTRRLCGLEAGPNTLTISSGKKNASPENVKLWELHKWGQSGFRTGRKSAFLKCYHIWFSSYSNFHRCGVTMTTWSARLLGDGQRDLGERQDIDVRTGVRCRRCRRGHVCWIFLSLCILNSYGSNEKLKGQRLQLQWIAEWRNVYLTNKHMF